jgi:AP-1 complex subunit mu
VRALLRVCAPQGSAVYAPEKSALVWHMRNFPGGKEYMLR